MFRSSEDAAVHRGGPRARLIAVIGALRGPMSSGYCASALLQKLHGL